MNATEINIFITATCAIVNTIMLVEIKVSVKNWGRIMILKNFGVVI